MLNSADVLDWFVAGWELDSEGWGDGFVVFCCCAFLFFFPLNGYGSCFGEFSYVVVDFLLMHAQLPCDF